ncbi:MAG: adenylate/guanylate cyclase domain-containing protein [Acidimicrobiia bacterium]
MLTYLFSDIASSTRLWEENPTEMAPALARHDAIFSAAIANFGGRLVKTTGDGGLAVFDSAGDGLAAALETQRNLTTETWGDTGPIRVRMGIHSGESENRDGDVFGTAVNRAARIMAAGHGGQVLVSGMSAELATDTLPDGGSLRDLGMHRLKDLTLPEHLFQLVHPDLVSEFAAPLTLDSRPHNLPLQTTEFLGRTTELAAIEAMLESPNIRLLTIAGPGGAGKTRLGLQVAADQSNRFTDGVFFVDVSMERDPDAAMEAIVRALNIPSTGGADALGLLKTRLRDKEMLLLLDNFEQVTAAAVGIAELLQHAPKMKVIVTSRETLRVRAEFVFPVPPLSLPRSDDPVPVILESEAVQLFVERARAVDPSFEPTEENASTIAEICLRLDGLPLAIELAAARLNVFTPKDLIVRLRERLDVLGSGGRDVPDRQRTLWGAIGWSYELLANHERALFELLAVFSTSDLTSIEAVARETLEEFDVDSLASLVDKSLVQVDNEKSTRRFGMLLMIKEYATERLAETQELDRKVRLAHARHFSDFAHRLADGLGSGKREEVLEELASEIGNLRTAWRFWVDQGEVEELFNLIDGLWALHEARGWYHAAIELASDTLHVLGAHPSPERAADELIIRTSLARALMAVRGWGPEVEEAFKQVLEMADTTGTIAQRYPVLRALWVFHMNIAQFDQSLEIAGELLGMAEEDETLRADAEYLFGAASAFCGRLEEGLAHLDKSIELFDPSSGSSRYRMGTSIGVTARVASGILLWQCGSVERGAGRVSAALAVARQLDHPFSVAWALYHNGFLALSRYRFEECIQFADELARVSDENDYLLWRTLSTVLEGFSRTAMGEIEIGMSKLEAAIDLYQGLSAPPIFWPLILSLRAAALAMTGQPESALSLIEEAIEIEGGADQSKSPNFWTFKGDFHTMTSPPDLEAAAAAYSRAVDLARAAGFDLFELQALTRSVALRRKTGESPDGSDELAKLYGSFTEGFEEHDLLAAKELLGTEYDRRPKELTNE